MIPARPRIAMMRRFPLPFGHRGSRPSKSPLVMHSNIARHRKLNVCALLAAAVAVLQPANAHASLFHGETLDAIANGISWVVLVIAPIIGITVFWLVHILP